ncbi:MAG: hypothetical protein QNJ18_04155 [Xenococcaceae cyanobacterium MO_167.B52]|nr:hypothetical protein [Xenococcaceae cyanobacterium MO_167.B52]
MNRKISLISAVTVAVSFLAIPISAQHIATNTTLESQFTPNPLILEGMSGGKFKATELAKTEETATGYCDGYVNLQPNHILVLENFFEFLKIEVESNNDTTILVQGPGGVWCNDDSYNTNPVIQGEWQQGSYRIWIGSYQKNSSNNYQIKITE